jgi:hypothetical protein
MSAVEAGWEVELRAEGLCVYMYWMELGFSQGVM